MVNKYKVDRVLNLQGLLCPRPGILASRALEEMAQGDILEIIANDKNSRQLFDFLCKKHSYKLLEFRDEPGRLRVYIKK
jgi:TusA-related sulfurtransferase